MIAKQLHSLKPPLNVIAVNILYVCMCTPSFFPPVCPVCSKPGRPVCLQAEVSCQSCLGDQIQRGGARGLIWGTGQHLTGTTSLLTEYIPS